MVNKIYCEIIPIHIGSPNHRNFARIPAKNEDSLRLSGLIPVSKNQANTLIPPSNPQNQDNQINQNFEYSKRIGYPAKRSTYSLQNSRNQIDHSSYPQNQYLSAHQPNSNFYEREKLKVFNDHNYSPNTYQQNIHQPKNYGYIFNGNTNNYDYHRNTPQQQPYNQQSHYNQYGNHIPQEQHYNQQPRDNQEYQQQMQNVELEKELNDIGLDNYDMSFDQQLDGGHLFNDNAMNFDMPNLY